MTIPYTYLLKHEPTNKFYYGCRFAKGCNPSEFWKKYKTSSKVVKQLVEEYGEDSFIFEIRKTFSDVNACRKWETKVLKRMNVVERSDFINQTDNISISREASSRGKKNKHISEEHKQIVSKIGKANAGRKHSQSAKQKISEFLIGNKYKLGKKESFETRQRKRTSKLGKPSNAVGNHQPRCSCVCCGKELTSSVLKVHFLRNH